MEAVDQSVTSTETGQGSPPPASQAVAPAPGSAEYYAQRKAVAFAAAEAEAREQQDAEAGTETPPSEDGPRDAPTDRPDTASAEEPKAEDAEDDRPLTRRSWAAQRKEFETKLADLETKLQSTTASKAQIEQARDEAEELTAQFLGLTPTEDGSTAFDRIKAAFERGDSGADREFLRYTKNREFFGALSQKAQKAGETLATNNWIASYYEARDIPGVELDKLQKVQQPGDALKYVAEAHAAAIRKPLDDRIAELEADLKDARAGRAARSTSPIAGGRSAHGSDPLASTYGRNGRIDDDWIERAKRGEFAALNLRD